MSPQSTQVLVSSAQHRNPDHARRSASLVLILLGVAFAVVGLVDLALLWYPLRFESVAWEFATVGRTLDALPMPLLGLGLASYGTARNPKSNAGWTRTYGMLYLLLALVLIGLAVLMATSAPAVLSQTPADALVGVRRAVIRHGVQSVVYPVVLAILGVKLWRTPRS